MPASLRNLVLVVGDQLDANAAAFDGFDPRQDAVWMAEVMHESQHIPSGKPRTAFFLSAMRHFRDALRAKAIPLHYTELDADGNQGTLGGELARSVAQLRPQRLIVTEPGEWRVWQELEQASERVGVALEIRVDRHFLCTLDRFRQHAVGRAQLRMEYFYREMRREHGVLLDAHGEPAGGNWNYDPANRGSFGKAGPGPRPAPAIFPADATTREVIAMVNKRFPGHLGQLEAFAWPVTPGDARRALADFIEHRLPDFGKYQDAMWTGEPWLYHARISATLNLKLLDPREVIAAAEQAYLAKKVPLASAEGFIRQILGWREYVRGVYWLHMPGYLGRNALKANESLPSFYWTGETEMNCLRHAINQTLEHGYAHHIQRLMVTGLYALLLGVKPAEVHAWYLGVYVDAVEWVELPNTLGMSQYADGGVMGSKPYAATGAYINRMSNYCAGCRFDPALRTGDDACPYTTLYWDFLHRHERVLAANPRMALQVKNLGRIPAGELGKIQERAAEIRNSGGAPRARAQQGLLPL